MGKKLITVGNFSEYIRDNKIIIETDMIITPGAKDKIREQGIETVYQKSNCECRKESQDKNCQDFEKKVIEILVKQFNITAPETVGKILSRLKELSREGSGF